MFLSSICFSRSRMLNKFIGKTVIVKNGDVDGAMRVLNRIMGSEDLFNIYRRTRYYEKPFNTRRRISWQICKAIYDEDMNRKIKFVSRKNRINPNPAFIF
ncbi:WW domain-containing adapter protein with coiled-coil [Sarcoptes scabiei]|nr:WW domain-containing adapter protein with coiled-coil [Sarcoptes scabiei]